MKTTKISVSISRTVNIGNFESVKLSESIEVELDDRETDFYAIDVVRDRLSAKVEEDAIILAKQIIAKRKK